MGACALSFAIHTAVSLLSPPFHLNPTARLRNVPTMGKTEVIMIILILLILGCGIWFVFSDQLWTMVSYLETLLYPGIVTPE
ncbi:Ecr family regulatory small membrane protein [[Enterobacter] lignolyticus]|uniref:Uncharacterized protein n=1 Tax=Enterobacter lignolyticus (strain SCF1) TaxID=701347 RepID=E3G3N7_ENTLS|nr:hypothetical protein Entcl_1953 [[Enterobacter] lignolyticus SCF1]